MFLRAFVAMVLLSACAPARHSPGTHYFAWAGLYTDPPTPTDPITRARAQSLAGSGHAFYVGEYGASGELLKLRKTYRGRTVVVWTAAVGQTR